MYNSGLSRVLYTCILLKDITVGMCLNVTSNRELLALDLHHLVKVTDVKYPVRKPGYRPSMVQPVDDVETASFEASKALGLAYY